MNKAITTSGDFKLDNTEVITISNVSFVYLFSNLIAMVGDTWLHLEDGGYKSKTTKSRLNAILAAHGNGEYIYQKKGDWYMKNGDGSVIPFVSGMKMF